MEPVGLNFDRPSPTVMIGREEVLRRTHLKKSTMYDYINKSKFPRQVKLTDGTVGWDEAEVEAWIQCRKAGRIWPSSEQDLPVPSKSPTVSRTSSMLAMPAQLPRLSQLNQLKQLDIRELKRLTGQALAALKSIDPEYFFDPTTGTVWLRLMQIEA